MLHNKLELTTGIYFAQSVTDPNNSLYNSRYNALTNTPYYPYARLADNQGNPLSVVTGYRQNYAQSAQSQGLLDWQYKPLDELGLVNDRIVNNEYRVNANLKYQVFPFLNATLLYQYDVAESSGRNLQSLQSYYTRDLINQFTQQADDGSLSYAIPKGAILDQSDITSTSYNLRGQLNYNQIWHTHHEITAIAGYELKQLHTLTDSHRSYGYDPNHATVQAVAYNTFYNLLPFPGYTAAIPFNDSETDLTDRYRSYYANASYSYDRKYTLSGSIRLDQSNLFGVKTNQKGVPLYSIGLGWSADKENFYHLDWLPQLKLRATYGYNGNVYKNVSAYTTAIASTSYSISPNTALPYATVQNPPNPELRWERVKMINIGLDFATKNNVLSGTLEYYHKNGYDLIGNSAADPTTGVSTFKGNNASTRGQGVDITLNSKNINRGIQWNTTLLFSTAKDIVTSYNVVPTADLLTLQQGTPAVGKALFGIYSRSWAGLDPQNGDPRGYINGVVSKDYTALTDGKNYDNLVYSGSAIPTIYGALRNTFSYHHLSLSVNISYRLGYYFKKNSVDYGSILTAAGGNGDYSQRWQKPGDELVTHVPSMPAVIDGSRDYFYSVSNALVGKADQIRLQDINLSYEFTRARWHRLPFARMELYCYANNLGLIWKANHFGIDPDYQVTGPPPRTVAAGLKIDF